MERQEGYYWVIVWFGEEPQIAEYVTNGELSTFFLSGCQEVFASTEFYWIDLPENRLTPPNI